MAFINDVNKLCMGCMEEKGDAPVCPKCGWVQGTQPESPLHLRPGTVLAGKYLVGRVLGHGGFGITYLACDINLGTKLAIKEYFPQGMATRSMGDTNISIYSGNTKQSFEYGLEKFIDEARTLAKFDGVDEIVAVKDFFKENGTAYLVMSYVEGITLKAYTEQNGGRLPLEVVLNIMLPIMLALEQVHNAGILHRDISPDNIFITKNFNAKLLDFGAARYAIGEHSKSLSVLLKPGYAPEEQYRTRGNQGPWTDVYAVGATIYKALTGQTPPEALDRLENDTIRRPSELGVYIDRRIEDALMQALSVRAVGRYQNIRAFYNAITLNSIDSNASTLTMNTNPAAAGPTIGVSMNGIPSGAGPAAGTSMNGIPSGAGPVAGTSMNGIPSSAGPVTGTSMNGIPVGGGYAAATTANGIPAVRGPVTGGPRNNNNKPTALIITTVIIAVVAVIALGAWWNRYSSYKSLQSTYDSLVSDNNSLNTKYKKELEFRDKISKMIPVYIDNITVYNEKTDGTVISKGTSFSSSDVQFIACDFTANLVDESSSAKDKIMIKMINPYGNVETYGDNSSPSGYTTSCDFSKGHFSIGTSTSNCDLNRNTGKYTIEFWYEDQKLSETSFNIN